MPLWMFSTLFLLNKKPNALTASCKVVVNFIDLLFWFIETIKVDGKTKTKIKSFELHQKLHRLTFAWTHDEYGAYAWNSFIFVCTVNKKSSSTYCRLYTCWTLSLRLKCNHMCVLWAYFRLTLNSSVGWKFDWKKTAYECDRNVCIE